MRTVQPFGNQCWPGENVEGGKYSNISSHPTKDADPSHLRRVHVIHENEF